MPVKFPGVCAIGQSAIQPGTMIRVRQGVVSHLNCDAAAAATAKRPARAARVRQQSSPILMRQALLWGGSDLGKNG